MNKNTYASYEEEFSELDLEALPTKSQISRMEFLEEELLKYEQINWLAYELLENQLDESYFITLKEAVELCEFMSDDDLDEVWYHGFSIPIGKEFAEWDYPIWETLLILYSIDKKVVSFLKVDDDEYEFVYSFMN